jgi:hypothetical protein
MERNMKYCQGPNCHTYETKDRLRGPKGAKTYQTRRRSSFYYLGGNACCMRCQNDWFQKFGDQAVNHFGRITEPKKLTADNAWHKDHDYDWQTRTDSNWRFVNKLTNEVRPITEEQYNNDSFTLNQG